jgi:proteasome beta subunit
METKQHKKGTTTVGIIAKDCVILAADQLATMGDFKVNTDVTKVFKIAENIAMTTAGTVGDNQSILRVIQAQLRLYELDIGQPTVKAAITLLSNMLSDKYQYSYLPYGIFDLLAGFDTKQRLYSIDLVGGAMDELKYSSTGSGMAFAYSMLDADYKENMSADDAVKLAVKSIVSARKRIGSVGGENITVLKIDAKGIHEIAPNKVLAISKAY